MLDAQYWEEALTELYGITTLTILTKFGIDL